MLTEAEAWRMIGEAFEARAAHPELEVKARNDLAYDGLCIGASTLYFQSKIGWELKAKMHDRIDDEVRLADGPDAAYLRPMPGEAHGVELRAMLAYLFAEEAASAN